MSENKCLVVLNRSLIAQTILTILKKLKIQNWFPWEFEQKLPANLSHVIQIKTSVYRKNENGKTNIKS